jgi:hypothetical protein
MVQPGDGSLAILLQLALLKSFIERRHSVQFFLENSEEVARKAPGAIRYEDRGTHGRIEV